MTKRTKLSLAAPKDVRQKLVKSAIKPTTPKLNLESIKEMLGDAEKLINRIMLIIRTCLFALFRRMRVPQNSPHPWQLPILGLRLLFKT